MSVAARDRFGFERICYEADGQRWASSVRALFSKASSLPVGLDVPSCVAHIDGSRRLDRTCFAAVHQVPPGHVLVSTDAGLSTEPPASEPEGPEPEGSERHASQSQASDLGPLFLDAVSRQLAGGRSAAVSLSGGLDAAMVLAWVRALGRTDVPAYVLSPRLRDYNEVDAALRTAEHLGAEVVVVDVGEGDFRAALADTIAAVEEPLYNAHPVAKLLLARAMRRDGIELVLSGDGADHVVRRDGSADYLPLVNALFADAGVPLRSPFLDDAVVRHLCALPADPDKRMLRRLASDMKLPEALVTGPKVSRLAPPIELEGLVAVEAIATLAGALGRQAPAMSNDRERMRWSTLAMLADAFDAWPPSS